MLIGFFVNDLEREYVNYTTTVLAHMAAGRGHRVCYITPADFVLNSDDSLSVHGRFLPKRKYKDRPDFFDTLKDPKATSIEQVDVTEIDVLMLRNDPSIDSATPWAMEAGILFGREAVRRGVIVLNDPDSLGKAINKLYFQGFPVEARAETLITKHASDIKAFAKSHGDNIVYWLTASDGVQSMADGKKVDMHRTAGEIKWSGPVVHDTLNTGKNTTKVLVIELKEAGATSASK